VERRRAQLEESVSRYLSQLDTADRQEPTEALAAKVTRLKEKLAKVKEWIFARPRPKAEARSPRCTIAFHRAAGAACNYWWKIVIVLPKIGGGNSA
jgi:hypothetical protein